MISEISEVSEFSYSPKNRPKSQRSVGTTIHAGIHTFYKKLSVSAIPNFLKIFRSFHLSSSKKSFI